MKKQTENSSRLKNNSVKIQKFIAMNSEFSRRKAEELINEGRVCINSIPVEKPGARIDPEKDKITIDGKSINKNSQKIYLALNKPAGYTTTRARFPGEKSVMKLLEHKNVYPAGRLDKQTEGLLIFTNDGDFAYRLTHPKFEREKEYIVHLQKPLNPSDKNKLEKGIMLDHKKTSPCRINKIKQKGALTIVNIIIHEGRKRQIRRMFEAIGNTVIYLKRIRMGKILLGDLPAGDVRFLTAEEVKTV